MGDSCLKPTVGIVVIGRNEGDRLVRCLRSVDATSLPVVYVDSASTDGSAARAAALGAVVVPLGNDVPFTAGRARNAGFARLQEVAPDITFVQFVDGDCEVQHGWLQAAEEHLASQAEVAIVCGRRSERFPERSIYNRLCDIEWDTPIGEAEACGGDFLARASVFRDLGGFNDTVIAGEEPELCHRVRKAGLRIHRIDRAMTLHDAAMYTVGQWMRRTSRSGYAYAAGLALHHHDGSGYRRAENIRIALWAAVIPAGLIAAALLTSPLALLGFAVYPLQILRVAQRNSRRWPVGPSVAYATSNVLGKWPEFAGQLLFLSRAIRRRPQRIIEYK